VSTPPSERAKLFVDECAAIVLGAVQQYGAVASRIAGQIDSGDFGAKEWFRSMTLLWDVAAINTVAFATTVAAGPGARLAPKIVSSAETSLLPKVNHERILYIAEDFKLPGGSASVPGHRVRFVPTSGRDAKLNPLGLLSAGEEVFRVEIHVAGLPGGTYLGKVRARPHNVAPDPQNDPCVTVPVIW
jgi:hypothetical protein